MSGSPASRTAALLSFVFCGLGQIYNGQVKKGLVLFSLAVLATILMVVGGVLVIFSLLENGALQSPGWIFLAAGFILLVPVAVYSVLDAYRNAK